MGLLSGKQSGFQSKDFLITVGLLICYFVIHITIVVAALFRIEPGREGLVVSVSASHVGLRPRRFTLNIIEMVETASVLDKHALG